MGGNRVHSGGSTPPDDKAKNGLYAELKDIGTKEKTLRPAALAKYRLLLDSPEVQRRAGPNADMTQRAECASIALRDKIDSLADEIDWKVAQAALAATPEFEGLNITARIHNLDGISENVFKVRRRKLFHDFVEYLYGYPRPFEPDEPNRPSLSDKEGMYVGYGLESLTGAALTLHFAGRACLFTYMFDKELAHCTREYDPLLRVREACSEHLFNSFIDFLERTRNWHDIPTTHRLGGRLTEAMDAKLDSLIGEVSDLWPLAKGPEDRRGLHVSFEAVLELGGSLYRRDLYDDIWLSWYSKNLTSKSDAPSAIELLTIKSGELGKIAVPYFGPGAEIIFADTHLLAERALEQYYGCHMITVLANGKRLKDYTSPYLNRIGAPLPKV